jgi:hypothetical protein
MGGGNGARAGLSASLCSGLCLKGNVPGGGLIPHRIGLMTGSDGGAGLPVPKWLIATSSPIPGASCHGPPPSHQDDRFVTSRQQSGYTHHLKELGVMISMKRAVSFSLTMFVCVCLLLATERPAKAYVDPGSGLLALQSAASVVAAAAYFLRRRIVGLFTKKKPSTGAVLPVAVRKDDSRNAA